MHAKRKFYEAYKANELNQDAKKGEEFIQKLFMIEHMADKNNLSYEERLSLRQEKSQEIFDDMYKFIDEITPKTLPKSLLGSAIKYALNQKEYLGSFLKDGRIQLSNNLAEQSIKPFVIGRKNWLFSNTPGGASASSTIYSIIQTALANNLKPFYYLEYVFTQIQLDKNVPMEELLPWSEKIPNQCKNELK